MCDLNKEIELKLNLTPSLYCRKRLLLSFLPYWSMYFCLYPRTVSTWVLCFTANSNALEVKHMFIVLHFNKQSEGNKCTLVKLVLHSS